MSNDDIKEKELDLSYPKALLTSYKVLKELKVDSPFFQEAPFSFFQEAPYIDSVPMDEEEKFVLDYSVDKLMNDSNFLQSVLSGIVKIGSAIEELYGSPQDIEGVVKDGKIYVAQTRPQM